MPRGSTGSSSKRQGLHSNNHGSLALPKRSNRSRSSSSVTPLAVASTNQPAVPEVLTAAAQFHSSINGTANSDIGANGWHGKGQRFYDCLGDDSDSFGEGTNSAMGEHQKIYLNPNGGMSSDVFPSTVLTSFPLLDTITLLIVFLQIPPTILTLIHSLFFLQTFVPPSTTIFSVSTTASMPSFTNFLLQGSNGSPSLLTIMFADCILASVSLFLWPSAWNFLIDFAQAIIAMTLGAGNSTGDSLRNVAVCAGVMGSVKVVQGRFRLSDAWESIQPTRQQRVSHILSSREESVSWLRTFFAIHIVAQAAMKATRRWLIRRPESADTSSGTPPANVKDGPAKQKDKDPEAAAGSSPMLTTERDNTGGKRKKKTQLQNVRNNQPLWATMASAVIHIAKEVERTQLSSEASNTNAGSAGTASNDATSGGEDSSVWITKIRSTEIGFVVGLVGRIKGEEGYGYVANGGVDAAGRDSSFPFFVRVNGIVWPQTDILPLVKTRDLGDANGDAAVHAGVEDEWAVDVTGLTGSTEYDFEFVKRGGAIFYSTCACTMPAQASAVPSVNHQPSRPLSPVTTLLNSLAQAKTCLAETKSNLKSIRKTHKAALSELRKEIEKHRGLIGNDRGEERAFRRNLALRESIKRAEEETEVMEKQLADLQQPPEKLKPEWEVKKKQWQAEKHRLAAAQTKAAEEKANADRKAAAVESELAILSSKKEKLMARLTKLNVDLGKLDSANSEGSDTKEKKQAEREASEERRERLEKEYLDAIHRLETRIEEYGAQSRSNWAAYYALESTTPQQTVTDVPIPSSAQGCGSLISNRERSSSLFSDGSVITNLSELGNPGVLPAFGPIPNRHASAEYTLGPMAVVGRGEGGE